MKNSVQSPGPITIDQRSDEWRDLAEAIGIDINRHAQFTVRDVIDEARKMHDLHAQTTDFLKTAREDFETLRGDFKILRKGYQQVLKKVGHEAAVNEELRAQIAKLKGDIEQLKGTVT